MTVQESLLFEQERSWTEAAIAKMGLAVVSCFLVAEKAREICAQYRDKSGEVHDLVIRCLPDMTAQSVAEEVRLLCSRK
jgi:hypothetical protein